MKKSVDETDIVAAVLVAFLQKNGIHFWQGTEEKLYEELTKFKNDETNEPDIGKAWLKLEKARKAAID